MTEEIIAFARDRHGKELAHIPYVAGRIFIETDDTHGAEFEALLASIRPGVIVGIVSMGDFGRGLGSAKAQKAIEARGGVVRVYEPKAASRASVPSVGRKTVDLETDLRTKICDIWALPLSINDRVARINAIEGVEPMDRHQINYVCVVKPMRTSKRKQKI